MSQEKKSKATWSERAAKMKEMAERAATELKAPPPPGHDADLHGALVQKVELGTRTVECYEGGYVRVSAALIGKAKWERLVSVIYRESTVAQDQSAVGAAITNTLSLGTSSTEKIKTSASITIVTENSSYSGAVSVKHGRAIEALVDRRRLGAPPAPAPTPPAPAVAPDLTDQIRKLADLHAAGILTDEEFSTKKADLLSRM